MFRWQFFPSFKFSYSRKKQFDFGGEYHETVLCLGPIQMMWWS